MKTFSNPALLTSAVAILLGTACSGSVSLGEMNDGDGTAGSASSKGGEGGGDAFVDVGGTGGRADMCIESGCFPAGGVGGVGGVGGEGGAGGEVVDTPCRVGDPCSENGGATGKDAPCADASTATCVLARAEQGDEISSIATDGEKLFVAYHGPRDELGDYVGPGRIVELATDGSAAATTLGELPGPTRISVTDRYVHSQVDMDGFEDGLATTSTWRVPRDGEGPVETLGKGVDSHSYGAGHVAFWYAASDVVEVLEDDSDEPRGVAIPKHSQVFGSDGQSLLVAGGGAIRRVPLDGSDPEIIANWGCRAQAWDGSAIYCAGGDHDDENFRIVTVPDTGGAWKTVGLFTPSTPERLHVNGDRGALFTNLGIFYWSPGDVPGHMQQLSRPEQDTGYSYHSVLVGPYVIFNDKSTGSLRRYRLD